MKKVRIVLPPADERNQRKRHGYYEPLPQETQPGWTHFKKTEKIHSSSYDKETKKSKKDIAGFFDKNCCLFRNRSKNKISGGGGVPDMTLATYTSTTVDQAAAKRFSQQKLQSSSAVEMSAQQLQQLYLCSLLMGRKK